MENVSPAEAKAPETHTRPHKRMVVTAFILGVIVGSALIVAASYLYLKTKKHALEGKWFCRTTLTGIEKHFLEADRTVAEVHEISIVLNVTGDGSLSWLKNNTEADKAAGWWSLKNDFLIIERSPGGFAVFRIASQGDNRLTLVNRGGIILEFTRVN